jgi:sulfate adenylyltransferase subunit 1 (EFTu-like GTPase family)
MEKINKLESITLNQSEKESFAKYSIPLRFEEHLEINHNDLLIPHREQDLKDDLYTVLNVIQENLLRGNIQGINKDTKRRFTSKEITSISKDTEVNKGIWDIAEKIASIKDSSYCSMAIAA